MEISRERWIWRFYLDISIDLKVIEKVHAHLLGPFKGVNEKFDGDGFCFDLFILLSCH